ncbi:extracellular solute-binding protein [Neoactinobaculum massilliense]|uniref:extracellular solute-binding protein n=1 Tax=Neoactinobaculum massilliense TaxID=2364794 RepID=UPI000F53FC8D|nr:extracellular solute-binding protein [Neoactinobaculum massilliense]
MNKLQKRAGKWLGILGAFSLALAGCSSSSGSVGDAKTDTNADKGLPIAGQAVQYDPNTLVNDGKPIQLQWWAWQDVEQYQQIADDYQKIHPNVDIQVVNQPWDDYWTKLPLELKGSNGSTLFNIHNSQHNNIKSFLEPYDIPVDKLKADYEGVATHIDENGTVPYIDLGFMSGAIYYNTDMWNAAGLTEKDIPTTWSELRTVAKKLTERDSSGNLTRAGFSFNDEGSAFQMGLAYQRGQNLFKSDLKTPDVDNSANRDVITTMLAIYEDGSGDKDFGASGTDSFGQGQAAMTYAWGWFSGTLRNDYPDINWSAFPTPVPDDTDTPYAYDRYNGESTFGINANASDEQKAVAQDFLRYFLTNKEALLQLSKDYSVFPSYKPIADDPSLQEDPAIAAFRGLDRYIWPGNIPATFETNYGQMWQDILYNGVTPADGLTSAQKNIETDLKSTEFTSVENRYEHYQQK